LEALSPEKTALGGALQDEGQPVEFWSLSATPTPPHPLRRGAVCVACARLRGITAMRVERAMRRMMYFLAMDLIDFNETFLLGFPSVIFHTASFLLLLRCPETLILPSDAIFADFVR